MNSFAELLYEALLPAMDVAWHQADAANEAVEQASKEAA
jgi:hypothetical protein